MSVIFADGKWAVLSQTIKVKGVEMEVPVKLCQYCPPKEKPDGTQQWFKIGRKDENGVFIGNPQWQVVLCHVTTGQILKVRCGKNGWRVRFPDREVKENWWDVKTTTVPGETYPDQGKTALNDDQAGDYLTKRFGNAIAQWVLCNIIDHREGNQAAA